MLATVPFSDLTRDIIAAAIEVHRVLGPGLLESAYSTCLLKLTDLPVGLVINLRGRPTRERREACDPQRCSDD